MQKGLTKEWAKKQAARNKKSVTKLLRKNPLSAQGQTNKKLTVKEHYRGMPEFVQNSVTAYQKVVVHLVDEQAALRFFKLINRPFTTKTRSIWFPEIGEDKYQDKRYSDKPVKGKK